MSSDVIRLKDVQKSYGERPVLRGITVAVSAGEAVGYLGPNGAGKTTTLRLLSGLTRCTGGSVEVLGRDPGRDPQAALTRVGVLVETPGIVPYLTGNDLLGHAAVTKGIVPAQRTAEILRVAEGLSVVEHLDRPMGSLSTGLTRRVLLGAALIGDPEVLLLDEPTLGLDPAGREDLRHLLRGLRREGRTILLSTHLLDDVQEVCDRVLFLRDGQLVGDERVHPQEVGADGRPLRVVSLQFSEDVAEDDLRGAMGPVERIERAAPRSASVTFAGGDRRQTELVAALVRAGLPLLGAAEPANDLGRRYLERVGREDSP